MGAFGGRCIQSHQKQLPASWLIDHGHLRSMRSGRAAGYIALAYGHMRNQTGWLAHVPTTNVCKLDGWPSSGCVLIKSMPVAGGSDGQSL